MFYVKFDKVASEIFKSLMNEGKTFCEVTNGAIKTFYFKIGEPAKDVDFDANINVKLREVELTFDKDKVSVEMIDYIINNPEIFFNQKH